MIEPFILADPPAQPAAQTAQHTAEPWEAVDCIGALQVRSTSDETRIAHILWSLRSDEPASHVAEARANVERIVTCVNACSGLSSDALEGGALSAVLEAIGDLIAAGETDGDAFVCADEDAARLRDAYQRLKGAIV